MKKHLFLPLYLITVFSFLFACSGSKELRKSKFTYYYDDNKCEITSINSKTGEGSNFISVYDKNGAEVFKAGDLNQDGWLDQILGGTVSMDDANLLYQSGIQLARDRGNYVERYPERNYEHADDNFIYTVRTYTMNTDHPGNMYIMIQKETGAEFIFQDFNADGTLDKTEKGNFPMEQAQIYYLQSISKGVKAERIDKEDSKYLVRRKKAEVPS